MKKLVSFVFMFFSIFVNAWSQQTSGFKTPEDLVQYYVQNINNLDLDQSLENTRKVLAYNYNFVVEKIDSKAYIERYRVQLDKPKLRSDSLSKLRSSVSGSISSILLFEQFGYDHGLNREEIEKYISSSREEGKWGLTALEFVRMDVCRQDLQSSDRHKQIIEERKKTHGFDEQVQYVVLYKYSNNYYVGGLSLLRYADNWYIDTFGADFVYIGEYILPIGDNIEKYFDVFDIKR